MGTTMGTQGVLKYRPKGCKGGFCRKGKSGRNTNMNIFLGETGTEGPFSSRLAKKLGFSMALQNPIPCRKKKKKKKVRQPTGIYKPHLNSCYRGGL